MTWVDIAALALLSCLAGAIGGIAAQWYRDFSAELRAVRRLRQPTIPEVTREYAKPDAKPVKPRPRIALLPGVEPDEPEQDDFEATKGKPKPPTFYGR